MGTATLGYPGGPSIAFRLDRIDGAETANILMSMTDTHECDALGCHDPVKRRKWCGKHYQRWLKYADPLATRSRWDGHELVAESSCSFGECTDPVLALGLCSKHYQRQQAHGDPGILLRPGPAPLPSENYFTQHKHVTAVRGRPVQCEHCGTRDQGLSYDWAFNHAGDRNNPADYLGLCRSCHAKFDQTPEKLAQLARARSARGGGA